MLTSISGDAHKLLPIQNFSAYTENKTWVSELALLDIIFPLDETAKLFVFERMPFFDRRSPAKRKALALSEIEYLDRKIQQTPNDNEHWAERCTLIGRRVVFYNIQLMEGKLPTSLDKYVLKDLVEFFGAGSNLDLPVWKAALEMWRNDRLLSEVAPSLSDGTFVRQMTEKRRDKEAADRLRAEGAAREQPIMSELTKLRSLGEKEYALARQALSNQDGRFARHIFAFERIQAEIGSVKARLKYADPGQHWVDTQRTG